MASFGQQKGSSKQSSTPWAVQEPHLQGIYERGESQSYDPREFYPDSTVVPYSSETEQAYRDITARARGGSPGVAAAQQLNAATIAGQGLDPANNPYLEATYDAAARPINRSFQTTALPGASLEAYGRGGSGAEANRYDRATDAQGRALTDLATGIYGGNFDRERGYQQQAARDAPALADYDYRDAQALLGVGQGREDLAQRRLQEMIERFQFAQEEPRDRLREYAGIVGAPVTTSSGRQKSSGYNVGILS